MSSCNGNCSTCGSDCADRKQESLLAKLNEKASVKKVIAVVSGKGGTGKTTVCAGVDTALARSGKRVLCIDCDVGLRNLDIGLAMTDCATLSFLDLCRGDYSLDHAPAHPKYPSLRFLTAPISCTADAIDSAAFGALVRQARQRFKYVFLDAPAGIDEGFQLAARFADRMLLVTGPDPASVRDVTRAGELLELMGKQDVRLVVNRVASKTVSAMSVTIDDVMDTAGLPLLGIVPEDPEVVLAAAFEKPLLKQTRKGAAAACCRIAKRIQGRRVPVSL